jgi:glutathione synthase/RimK-type ligase-like ATP-grasp enzyme
MSFQRDIPRLIVLGNPGSKRVEQVSAAAVRVGLSPVVVPWLEWIEGRQRLDGVVSSNDIVRIESPGKDFEVERAILGAGAECDDEPGFARGSRRQIGCLGFDKGRILWPRQWYLGFVALLGRLKAELAGCGPHVCMNDPDEIATMFDKPACHAALRGVVPVPKFLGIPGSFDELVGMMGAARVGRVFVKLAHGSSASGVVACQTSGGMHRAVTTVEVVREGGELRLYNTRRLRVLTGHAEISELVDELCRHRVCVERWIPKAGMSGKTFDMRVVVIGGKVCHTLARLSDSPVTNLHLLNDRCDASPVRRRMGEEAWGRAMESCERVMARFGRSLYAGVDLLIGNDFRSHAVIEVNAFGDQIPGTLFEGRETYDVELGCCLAHGALAGAGA